MKGLGSSSISNVHDFLQDAQGFLEQTLASEKLSRTALEHRTRLLVKLTGLMKEYDNHQMEMYIDMSPALRSFFHPSDSSTSDNSSVKDTVSASEALYEVPVDGSSEYHSITRIMGAEDQCDASQSSQRRAAVAAPLDSSLLPEMAKQKRGFMERFIKSTVSGDKSQIIYDDATTLKAPSFLRELDTSRFLTAETGRVIYDDAFGSLPALLSSSSLVAEEYDLVDDSASEGTAHNNNDSDGISLKSGASEYGASGPSNTQWHVPATETKANAIRYGFMKRRNGRKLLSAWRRCYAVLLPSHLLMYAGETDSRPRIVIDLTEPQIRVSRVVKQGVDSKRLKTHPFVLLHEEKPLYEMSTKSREETDGWMAALQTVLAQVPEQVGIAVEEDNFYDIPSEVQQQQLTRVGDIQGRHLPSLPHEIPNDAAVESSAAPEDANKQQRQQQQQKLGNKVKGTKAFAILFRFPRSNRGSSEDDSSIASRKRQSVESSTNTDDVYQELPSPARSATPYSSVESLGGQFVTARSSSSTQTEEIYHDVISSPKGSAIHHSRSNSDGLVAMTKPVAPLEDELPVYDIPSPTIRPLSCISLQNDTEVTTPSQNPFARLLSQSRARLFHPKPGVVMPDISNSVGSPESLEVYDVPMVNPRRISVKFDNSVDDEDESAQNYDLVTTPPRAIAPLPPQQNGNCSAAPKQKLARYWQDKISEAGKQTQKSDSKSIKCCLPVQTNETKSVGRSFSRLVTPRTPLASLTELLTSSSNELIKPSALRNKFSKLSSSNNGEVKNLTSTAALSRLPLESKELSKTDSDNVKKEPPPRPPAPPRPVVMKKPSEAINSTIAELNQQFRKRANDSATSSTSSESSNPPSPVGEQYKARWAYVAQNSLELSINSGEIVQVLTKNGPCWLVKARNKKGLVPKEYLIPISAASSNGNLWSFSSNGESPIAV